MILKVMQILSIVSIGVAAAVMITIGVSVILKAIHAKRTGAGKSADLFSPETYMVSLVKTAGIAAVVFAMLSWVLFHAKLDGFTQTGTLLSIFAIVWGALMVFMIIVSAVSSMLVKKFIDAALMRGAIVFSLWQCVICAVLAFLIG